MKDKSTFKKVVIVMVCLCLVFASFGAGSAFAKYVRHISLAEFELDIDGTNVPETLEITKEPNQTIYNYSDKFDPTGMEITVHYTDGTSAVVDNYTIVNGDKSLTDIGHPSLTISYTENGFTVITEQQITVRARVDIRYMDGATPNKTIYTLSLSDLGQPSRTGYTFINWYIANESGGNVTLTSTPVPETITQNIVAAAKWEPNEDTPYTVRHWKQNLNAGSDENESNFTLEDTDSRTGTTDAQVTPEIKNYTGFRAPSTQTVVIAADGSLVVDYYYTRNSYTFTLGSKTGANTAGSSSSGSYQYGATIALKATANDGYNWTRWDSNDTSLVGNKEDANTSFKMPAGSITMTPIVTEEIYNITYDLCGGSVDPSNPASYTVTTESITLNNPTRRGYTFAGWTGSNGTTPELTVTITKGSTGNKSYTANWTANNDTAYTVKHWQQKLDAAAEENSTNYTLQDTDNLTGTTATNVTPAVKSYTGFTAPGPQTVTITADGSTVVNYYYTRNSYTFTLGSGTGVTTTGSSATGTYQYGATITLEATASAGYTWKQWTSSNTSLIANTTTANTSFTMPAGNITMTPSATPTTSMEFIQGSTAIQNNGSKTSYVRTAVVITWKDASGNIYSSVPEEGVDYEITYNLSSSGWVKGSDGFYYWVSPVSVGSSTDTLIKSCTDLGNTPDGYSLSVEVVSSSVQADSTTAINEAWGLQVDSSGNIIVS